MNSRPRPGPATLRHRDAVEPILPFTGAAELDETAGALLREEPADLDALHPDEPGSS
ncbi:hypothetical protein [Streptomyces spectabilis]|uniref:hypothetical protein n=1 Tax=Streptomyces spectabilis TaxID=68270 RepID=UPI001378D506|nr:hypothetical protein [Streptomyces spectabilis]